MYKNMIGSTTVSSFLTYSIHNNITSNDDIKSNNIRNSTDESSSNSGGDSFRDKYPFWCIVIVIIFFLLGVLGNFLALIILARKKASKNSKYTLMLRCLASNNLIGLMGMFIQLILKMLLPIDIQKSYVRFSCIAMVVWRFFGLSSGCIAAVMAAERWMALARPFTYHKHITYHVVKRCINYLILTATIITFLPLIGFGVYFDSEKKKCLRYRDATSFWDVIYAYVFMIFGTLLCIIIVGCNFFVTRVLCFIGRSKTNKRSIHYDFVNDGGSEKRNSSSDRHEKVKWTNSGGNNGGCSSTFSHQCSTNSNSSSTSTSSDEIRFAKLMTFLSISFVICWMPQMISIPLALMPNSLPRKHWFFRLADILMALHFTSDPYVYVLSRTKSSFILDCIKRCRFGFGGGVKRSQSLQSRLRPNFEQTMDYGLNA